jgi:hypothetical protein
MRYVLFNDARLTMEARTKTFLALVKAVTISTERARRFTGSTIMTE